mgnify:FL=1
MKKIYLLTFLILFYPLQGVLDGYGSNFSEDSCLYISPGIQIGYNFDKGFFYGFQISTGIAYFHTSHYIFSPSMSYSLKKYFNSKEKEKFFDYQIMALADTRYLSINSISLGFGVGKNITTNDTRLKIYTWQLTSLTYDYEFKNKDHNFSIIPVFPIGDIWM